MPTAVTAVPPAPSELAQQHFSAEFTFETDCWDVHDALAKGADFVLLDVRSPALFAKGGISLPETPFAVILRRLSSPTTAR